MCWPCRFRIAAKHRNNMYYKTIKYFPYFVMFLLCVCLRQKTSSPLKIELRFGADTVFCFKCLFIICNRCLSLVFGGITFFFYMHSMCNILKWYSSWSLFMRVYWAEGRHGEFCASIELLEYKQNMNRALIKFSNNCICMASGAFANRINVRQPPTLYS